MIKLTDITILAFTKLRSRKVRTIVTIVLASLLFGLLVVASLVLNGVFKSVEEFREDSLTGRYIVSVGPRFNPQALYDFRRDEAVIAEAKSRYEALVTEKVEEAERLDLDYVQAMEQPPYSIDPNTNEEIMNIRDSSGIVYDLLEERFSNESLIDAARLAQTVDEYKGVDVFHSYVHTIRNGALNYLPEEGEIFYDAMNETESKAFNESQKILLLGITRAPKQITEPFLLEGSASWSPQDGTIPIILPQNEVEALLGAEGADRDEPVSEKMNYLTQLKEEASKLTFQVCYRNSDSQSMIQQVVAQNKEMKAGESDEEYKRPPVVYSLPDPSTCENPHIVSDTRTDQQVEQDDARKEFEDKFEQSSNPVSQLVTFKVVGISPPAKSVDPFSSPQAENINDIVTSLLETNGLGQAIPQHLYEQIPEEDKQKYADIMRFEPTYFIGNEDDKMYYAEFVTADAARKFIDEQACETKADGKCYPEDREYQAYVAFTNSAALDDIQSKASGWFNYAMLIVMAFAAIIMGITIGRTIADSRHETAIFRAIGFKRIDITMVYVVYSVVLAVLIALFASLLGLLAAYIADVMFAPEITAQAQYGFGGVDMSKKFSLVGFNEEQLVIVLLACLGSGLIGMIVPLLGNLRRNPMRDLRGN